MDRLRGEPAPGRGSTTMTSCSMPSCRNRRAGCAR